MEYSFSPDVLELNKEALSEGQVPLETRKKRRVSSVTSIRTLDRLFSELIRRRAIQKVGGCERCLSPKQNILKDNGDVFPAWKQLQTSHFWGRAKKSVRWDTDNAVGLCGGCHRYLTAHPEEHARWFQDHLGEQAFEFLKYRSLNTGKPDLDNLYLYLKAKLGEL